MPMILDVAPRVIEVDCRGLGRGRSPLSRFRRMYSKGHGRIARYSIVNQRIALVASGVLALALFGAVVAGPLEDGEVAYRGGDYAAAMSYWRALADQGTHARSTILA